MDRCVVIMSVFWILGLLGACTGQTINCGEISTSQAGTIKTPNFPSNYPDNATCTWTIIVASNQVITLRFHRFGVDPSDRVTFYDGNSTSSPVLNWYQNGYWDDAKVSNMRIRTSGAILHVVFVASGSPSGIGFSASYWAHECPPFTYGIDYCVNNCSCLQSNTRYCNNTSGECVCKSGLNTTNCDACNFGYQCKDPYSDCYKTSGSNVCDCRQGLQIDQSTGKCASTCTAQQNQCSHACGVISTNPIQVQCYCPHGMKLDPVNNRSCIECPGLSFGEDCKHQATCYRERTELVNKINGSCTCYKNWTSENCIEDFNECNLNPCNSTTTSYCSNSYGDYLCSCKNGFESIDRHSCTECGMVFTNLTGEIDSAYYYSYNQKPEVCWWTIIAAPGDVIDLSFKRFSLYGGVGSYDYVNIYDGANTSAPLLTKFDGLTYHNGRVPETIRFNRSIIHIVRYSNHSNTNGFTATYISHKCREDFYGVNCSTQCTCFKNNTVYCDYMNGRCECKPQWTSSDCSVDKNECLIDPLSCPDYSECTNLQPGYNCTCKPGLVMNSQRQCVGSGGGSGTCSTRCSHLCVHIQTSGQDYCYCPIGKKLVGDSCIDCSDGTYGPDCSLQCPCVTNNTVSCHPVTGQCVCKPGWTSDTCSQDIDECYFEMYRCPQYSTCRNTPGDYDCLCQYYYGLENNSTKTCKQIVCPHYKLTAPSGNISSPNYPNAYYSNANCTWSITTEVGKVISVIIKDFNLEPVSDPLTFYNGNNVNGKIIGKYSGMTNSTIPHIVRSVGNSMFITFTTNGYINYRGFFAEYYTHSCPDFMYGDTCTEPCRCNRDNTEYCDNIKGECLCKIGWKGYTCIDDVSECLGINNFLCPRDSDCRNRDGNYVCICHQGFLMNSTTKFCDPTNIETTSNPNENGNGNVHQDYACHLNYMSIHIPVDLVPESKLWLNEPSCQLVNNGSHHIIDFFYQDCGTSMRQYSNYTLVTNEITVHTNIEVAGPVVFGEDYKINVSCKIPKHQLVDGSFQAVSPVPIYEINENTTIGYVFREYETADYLKDITRYPVQMPSNKDMFFEISLTEQDKINNTFGVHVDQCIATPSLDPDDPTNFVLIANGCPKDYVHVLAGPGPEVYRFSVHSFHFTGPENKNNFVYIHCSVSLCQKTSCPVQCSTTGRRKRWSPNRSPATLTIGPYIYVP